MIDESPNKPVQQPAWELAGQNDPEPGSGNQSPRPDSCWGKGRPLLSGLPLSREGDDRRTRIVWRLPMGLILRAAARALDP